MLSPNARHTGRVAYELAADDKGVGDAARLTLFSVGELYTPLAAIAEKFPVQGQGDWGADDEDVPYPCQHQH